MKKFIKNVSYLMFVNAISFIISAVITLVVPKFLSVKEYSYFQLYLFYLNYIGFFCIGWIDGIVLRYGGSYYQDIDKQLFSGQFKLYSLLEFVIGIVVIVFAILMPSSDINEVQVHMLIGVAIVLVEINAFFRYLLQALNLIDTYAKNLLLEKLIYITGVIIILLCKRYNYIFLILVDLLAKLIALIHMMIINLDIITVKSSPIKESCQEAKKNISVGIKLLAANGSGLLIVGIIRYAIQQYWDVETFGKVSLSLSVSNMFTVFVQAVGVSLFPMLKRIESKVLSQIYVTIQNILMFPMFGALIFYYPIYMILSLWLPQYAESLHYMALMFPICIFESKMQLLIEPYLKSLRKETELLKINVSAVVLSILASIVIIGVLGNLNLIVLAIVIILGYRSVAMEVIVEKSLSIHIKKEIISELTMVILFIVFNWLVGGFIGVCLYLISYVVYVIIFRKNILNTVQFVRNGFMQEK